MIYCGTRNVCAAAPEIRFASPFSRETEVLMSAPTRLLPQQTCRDITTALAGVRLARTVGDSERERQWEARLDWLLVHIGKLIRGEY